MAQLHRRETGKRRRTHQRAHDADDQVDGAVGPDHDDVAIGDAGVVEVMGQDVGRLVDLPVGEGPLGGLGRLGLDDADAVGVLLGHLGKVPLDGADVARPVELDRGIW